MSEGLSDSSTANSVIYVAHVVAIRIRCQGMDAVHDRLIGMLYEDSPTHRSTIDDNRHLPVELLSPDVGCQHLGII